MQFKPQNNEIYLHYHEHFDFVSDLIQYTDYCVDLLDAKNIKRNDMTLFQKILGYIYCRASLTVKSIFHLANIGHVHDADNILRTLLETVVNMRYIKNDPEKRAKMYWYFGCLRNKQLAEKIIKDVSYSAYLRDGFKELYPEIQRQLEECRDYFPRDEEGKIPNKYYRNWSGKSIRAMAKEIGMGDYYNQPYYMHSIKSHGSIESFQDFFDINKLSYFAGPTMDAVDRCLFEASEYILGILDILNGEYDLKIDGEIISYKDKLSKLAPSP